MRIVARTRIDSIKSHLFERLEDIVQLSPVAEMDLHDDVATFRQHLIFLGMLDDVELSGLDIELADVDDLAVEICVV